MNLRRRVVGLVFVGIAAVAAACSGAPDPSSGDVDLGEAPPSKNKSGGDAPGTSSDESSGPSGAPQAPSSDAGGARDASPDADAAPPAPVFTCQPVTPAACAQARSAGTIIGDGTGTSTTIQGAGSQWLSIQVSEDSLKSESIGVTARLTSPDGSQLDVFLYDVTCKNLLASGVDTDTTSEAYTEWSDTYLLDDSRTILVEVRHVSGACDPTTKWTLELEGGVYQ